MPAGPHSLDPPAPDLGREHRAEPVPPEADGRMAFDAALLRRILDIPPRQRETNARHHRQGDDLKARLEVADGAGFGYLPMPGNRTLPLTLVCSDRAAGGVRLTDITGNRR